MSDAAALLAAIRAAPEEDAPRLAYADWLKVHGQPERAEFIRVQIHLARKGVSVLRRREQELLAKHHDAIAGPLSAPGLRFRFSRGFAIAFGHTGLFVRSAGARMRVFYRFKPDGSWWSRSGTESVQEVAELIRDSSKHFGETYPGPYSLEAFDRPVRIRFGWSAPAETWEVRGTLDGSLLTLEIQGEFLRLASGPQEFNHVHIHGLDSFPET
jgi:uncharacterized protein (TIGR02996 family)